MEKSRLEAFSDGVIAVIITIMVLELKPPHATTLDALIPQYPVFVSYVLSYVYVGTYWNNHHHLFKAVQKINGTILWANLHLLFWLSLVPFVTSLMGVNGFAQVYVFLYGCVLLMSAIAYTILTISLLSHHGHESLLARAVGKDRKGKISLVLYLAGMGLSFVHALLGLACYAAVAIIWLIPDTRIEKVLPRRSE